ncbi:MAG: hypothetical protein J6A08_05270 [Lachnospiraceae bacterium]|nr:hypothetical protein [Lachnospiraceae bacterium]
MNTNKKTVKKNEIEKAVRKGKDGRAVQKNNSRNSEKNNKDSLTKSPKRDKRRSSQEKRSWKEILYNCPYVLLVSATAIAAMLCSDEIGVNVMAMGESAAAWKTEAGSLADGMEQAEEEMSDQPSEDETHTEGFGDAEAGPEAVSGAVEHSAKDNSGDTEERTDGGAVKPGQTAGQDTADKPGITRFEYYEPQQIDSYYYSDAGRIALTTEYDYVLENDSYFNDAAFLGDSRTLGISDYAGLDGADFYCDSGMTIFKLLGEDGVTYQKTGEKVDMNQVLQEKQYGKIYIMLGMNELGYGNTEMYLKQYREVVEQIRQWQPEAIIYIMANLHVSREKNSPETEFNNININDKNAASALLANGRDIFYLDSNPLFTDEDGFLNAELTFDGVHLYAQHYDVWRQFLLEHGVERR